MRARKQRALAAKKPAKQKRAIATVEAIVEASTYILIHAGPGGFTANKVADKAGVNIASLYQYFPNKEALLFHIAKQTWEKQLAQLSPILTRSGADHAGKLRDFVREFFLIEAAEADLRQALRLASIDLKETPEFQELISRGIELTKGFIKRAVGATDNADLDFKAHFVALLMTSFAERTTDVGTSGSQLIRQADLLSDLLIAHFGIA